MKLNNKGWGFNAFIIYLSIFIFFIILVTILAIHANHEMKNNLPKDDSNDIEVVDPLNKEKNKKDYSEIEKTLEDATYQYNNESLPSMSNGDVKYVSSSKLEELKFLDNLTEGEVFCTGYAKITYEDNNSSIMGFINCGDYVTEGYNGELDD